MRAAVAFAVPDGASRFASWWSSTISARGNSLRRLLREAHHQHGAEREVRRDGSTATPASRAAASSGVEVEAGRPDRRTGTPAARHASTFADDRVGAREVDRRVASLRPERDARRRPRARPRRAPARARAPTLPAAPYRRDLHHAALASSAGFTRSTASEKRLLVGPDPGRREPLRREERAGELRDLARPDRLESPRRSPSSERSGVSVISRLPEPRHPVRGRLEREQDPALEVLLRPRELVGRARCPPRCPRARSTAISRHSARLSSRVPT